MVGSVLHTEAVIVHVSEFVYFFLHLIFHVEKGEREKKKTQPPPLAVRIGH